jgi:hypothetical protein
MLNSLVFEPTPFVAVTLNVKVPTDVGVPERTPPSRLNHDGKSLELHVIGVAPPAGRAYEYTKPTVPLGSDVVVIVGGSIAGAITMLKSRVALPAMFVACTVKLNVPASLGVPEITLPVKFNPSGKSPIIDHVIGPVPVACRVCV